MDHTTAVHNKAAEHYLLGEMTAAERDEYEEHYFACEACAEEVSAGAEFLDNAKAALGRRPAATLPAATPTWRRGAVAVPWAVCALLVSALSYQSAVRIPRLTAELAEMERPRAVAATLLRPVTRSEGAAVPTVEVRPGQPLVTLLLPLEAGRTLSTVRTEVRGESGEVAMVESPAPRGGAYLQVQLPARRMVAGRYWVTVRGADGSGPALLESEFVVLREE